MALLRIKTNESDICVSFVFRNLDKETQKTVLCKLVIRQDGTDAPMFTFWGRVEMTNNSFLLRGKKGAQEQALKDALSAIYLWLCEQTDMNVPMFNAVLSHKEALIDLFNENWKKSVRGTQRKHQKKH